MTEEETIQWVNDRLGDYHHYSDMRIWSIRGEEYSLGRFVNFSFGYSRDKEGFYHKELPNNTDIHGAYTRINSVIKEFGFHFNAAAKVSDAINTIEIRLFAKKLIDWLEHK